MTNILVVGDAHAKPGVSNERFTKLGRLAADYKPDVIVQIGDWADLPSLSLFDVGKKTFEGRNYKDDCLSVHDSLKKFQSPIDELNKELAAKKIKKYNPKKYITLGNHCRRIWKAVNSDRKLEGTMSIEDLRFEEFGWEVVPFLEPLVVEGITFQHYFTSGSMDRAIGGDNVGRSILKKYHSSCFAGHSHKLDLAWEANSRGELMVAGTVGCYFEHQEEWLSVQSQNQFWRGVTLLEGVRNGFIEKYQLLTMDWIKKNY